MASPTPSRLMTIPLEILLVIAENLPVPDLNSLIQTSSFFHRMLDKMLYDGAENWWGFESILCWAATEGQSGTIQKIKNRGGDLFYCEGDDGNLIHYAASNGHSGTVQMLLDAGLDPHDKDGDLDSTLHMAAISGSKETVEIILKAGVKASEVGRDQRTALHTAAAKGHADVVQLLLDSDVETSAPDIDGYTALHLAIGEGEKAAYQALLNAGANLSATSYGGVSVLDWAAENGRDEEVQLLVDLYKKSGDDINKGSTSDWTALHIAAEKGHESVVRILLENGMRQAANSKGHMPLHVAAKMGHIGSANLLLEKGADMETPNLKGMTALHRATKAGEYHMVKFLLNRGADIEAVTDEGLRPLHLVVDDGHKTTLSLLLQHDAEIDAADFEGVTPLMLAVGLGRESICDILLAWGASPLVADHNGSTLLHVAVEADELTIARTLVKALRQKGGSLDLKGRMSGTPLHWAIEKNNTAFVHLLMSNEADPMQLDCYGRSCLESAHDNPTMWDIMKQYRNYQATDRANADTALRTSIVEAATRLQGRGNEDGGTLYLLGRCLFSARDLKEGLTAFDLFSSPSVNGQRRCDSCSTVISGVINICLTCPEVDLCSPCTAGYHQTGGIPGHHCRGHLFAPVAQTRGQFASDGSINSRGESRQQWLTRLVDSYTPQ